LASDQLADDVTALKNMGTYIESNLNGMDPRISEYLNSKYSLSSLAANLSDYSTRTNTYRGWMDDTVQRVKDLDQKLAGNVDTGDKKGGNLDQGGTTLGKKSEDEYEKPDLDLDVGDTGIGDKKQGDYTTVDPKQFEQLPETVQDDIKDLLKELGYSDEEIAQILRGEKELTPEDMEKIKGYIDKLRETDPDLADKLDLTFGIPNDWAELPEETKNEIKDFLAGLGYSEEEISDIVHGKKQLTDEELEKLKAYLAKIAETNPELANKIRRIFGLPEVKYGSEGEKSDQPIERLDTDTDDIGDHDKDKTKGGEDSIVDGQSIAAGLPGTTEKDGVNPLDAASSISNANSDILKAIGKGASKLASGVVPYLGGNGDAGKNLAGSGVIAAAGLAAGGAAAGGGILVGKKLSVIKFTPKDWNALGEDYQKVIEKVMRRSGLTSEEIETFENSKFKILTSELKEHVKKIEKAIDNNPTFDDDFVRLYNYSLLDDNNKIVDYLLFITMIIDGRNIIDEYNMYNIINQNLEKVDDADFAYSGISMEDYYDDADDEENVKVEMANDPTIEKLGEEMEEESSSLSPPGKEWLQDIGVKQE